MKTIRLETVFRLYKISGISALKSSRKSPENVKSIQDSVEKFPFWNISRKRDQPCITRDPGRFFITLIHNRPGKMLSGVVGFPHIPQKLSHDLCFYR
jgi:hypothetical protein